MALPAPYSRQINLGKAYNAAKKGEAAVKAVVKFLGGELVEKGRIKSLRNEAKGGYDVGMINLEG